MSKNKTQALVICGHGSSLNLYKKDFEIAKKKIEREIQIDCFDCFIEKDRPSIKDCLEQVKNNGYDKIYFFPFVLFKGKHYVEDIEEKINFFSSNRQKIILVNQLSLQTDILPIIKKKIDLLKKKNHLNIFITFSSRSESPNLISELNRYTKNLGDFLKIRHIYPNFVGSEKYLLKQIEKFKEKKIFLIIHPVFLFKGYLFKKVVDSFNNLDPKTYHITTSLMNIKEVQNLVINKLKIFISRNNKFS
jgi:sirohydrochlorin ferrochelatase